MSAEWALQRSREELDRTLSMLENDDDRRTP
jgi:hypothetical protein